VCVVSAKRDVQSNILLIGTRRTERRRMWSDKQNGVTLGTKSITTSISNDSLQPRVKRTYCKIYAEEIPRLKFTSKTYATRPQRIFTLHNPWDKVLIRKDYRSILGTQNYTILPFLYALI
jgi:hypothetical protein